ncbi:hypothetical protein KO516_15650 [Citreicella sp. C3M06]|uniref:hypothetical protein n=1 Tax=Citreicella sp. C3M06 TaxID=2841564 RepID=UPI001C09A5FA|nr:hypothetical protein [Citreicella sp. C3M06]MBU2962222.1 hypothetical protein [Citreicella sp. C3M06]
MRAKTAKVTRSVVTLAVTPVWTTQQTVTSVTIGDCTTKIMSKSTRVRRAGDTVGATKAEPRPENGLWRIAG